MISKKTPYEAPEAVTLLLKIEGVVCQSGNMTIPDLSNDGDPLNF